MQVDVVDWRIRTEIISDISASGLCVSYLQQSFGFKLTTGDSRGFNCSTSPFQPSEGQSGVPNLTEVLLVNWRTGQIRTTMRPFLRRATQHRPAWGFNNTRPHSLLGVSRVSVATRSILPCQRLYTTENSPLSNQLNDGGQSQLDSKSHHLGWETIRAQVEPYFADNWKFTNEDEKQAFLALGLSRAFSYFFPLTLEGRIEPTCRMHYLALLIDGRYDRNIQSTFANRKTDQLDNMNLSDMLSYRARIMQVARRQTTPNKSVCIEWMLSETIQIAQKLDEKLANDLVQGFCSLLMAQTAPERTSVKDLGSYLAHREVDVGRP